MKHCGDFKAKKSNEYDLCHFYHIELSGDLPTFPSPHQPATHKMLENFLLKALGHPNLIVAFVQDSAMAVCLLQELHSKDSLRHLPMEPKPDTGGKATKKLSFCLFCLYNSTNDLSYMNHIVCRHYNANYGCGQCLKEVFTMGQQLKNHLKICVGFPKASTPSSSEKEPMPQGSQESFQTSPHHSQCPKKKELDSAKKSSKKVPSPRHTRSPNAARRRCLRRRSINGGTKQTRTSPTSPPRSEPHEWHASDVHPFAAMHAKGGTSVVPEVLFQL